MSPALPGEARRPIRRCESCGLGVVGQPEGGKEALAALAATGTEGVIRIANRASLQAWLGGAAWVGLAPDRRYLFTVRAARHLLRAGGQELGAVRWSPLASIVAMWQTLLNTLTFGRNVALASLGRLPAGPAPSAWQRMLDLVISVVLALPLLALAAVLELGDRLAGRGGVLVLTRAPAAR
jgi:hypothetical protein